MKIISKLMGVVGSIGMLFAMFLPIMSGNSYYPNGISVFNIVSTYNSDSSLKYILGGEAAYAIIITVFVFYLIFTLLTLIFSLVLPIPALIFDVLASIVFIFQYSMYSSVFNSEYHTVISIVVFIIFAIVALAGAIISKVSG